MNLKNFEYFDSSEQYNPFYIMNTRLRWRLSCLWNKEYMGIMYKGNTQRDIGNCSEIPYQIQDAIMIIWAKLYGDNSQSYGMTLKSMGYFSTQSTSDYTLY